MKNFDRCISTPISSSASFYYENSQEAYDIFAGNIALPMYSRMGNPTTTILEQKITKMEKGAGAVATSSGMGAISMTVMSLCSSGDEIIAVGGLFSGSYAFFSQTLLRFGIKASFFSADDVSKIENKITPNTKVIFCESVGNPNMRLANLSLIGKIATKHNIAFVVDNTITPMIVRPFEYKADIVIYSTTKIISGNSSALGGISVFKEVIENDKFHSPRYKFLKPFIKKLKQKALVGCAKKRALRDFGMSANANASYQSILGLETLELRNTKINKSCEIIAHKLEQQGMSIIHPSLSSHIDNALYKSDYKNGCGTMIGIDMQTKQKAYDFLDSCKFLTITANIGDSRTLGLHMATTIYQDFNIEEKKFLGVSDGLLRISIGLENPDDIIYGFLHSYKTICNG